MTTDIKTGRDLHEKNPNEKYPFDFVFTSFKDGESIASVNSVVQSPRGSVSSVPLVISNITHDGGATGQAWIDGGTNGEHYCLTMTVLTTLGSTRTCSGVLLIKDVCNG